MVSVIYKGRALPIAWLVHAYKKGQSSQKISIYRCWNQVHELIPKNTEVVFLGDGEFDGVQLIATLQKKKSNMFA